MRVAVPEMKWRSPTQVTSDREYVVMASRLPLKRFWRIPGFMRDSFRVARQLKGAKGMIWYSLRTELWRKRFWTLSVWESEEALADFYQRAPHSRVMLSQRPHMRQTKFERWKVPGSAIPPTWREALQRLDKG